MKKSILSLNSTILFPFYSRSLFLLVTWLFSFFSFFFFSSSSILLHKTRIQSVRHLRLILLLASSFYSALLLPIPLVLLLLFLFSPLLRLRYFFYSLSLFSFLFSLFPLTHTMCMRKVQFSSPEFDVDSAS